MNNDPHTLLLFSITTYNIVETPSGTEIEEADFFQTDALTHEEALDYYLLELTTNDTPDKHIVKIRSECEPEDAALPFGVEYNYTAKQWETL